MTACESCHQSGLAASREAARLGARWSVRSTFKHRTHTAKAAAECIACHSDLSSPTVLSLAFVFLIVGYVLIQLQIRLEEEFLSKVHGQKYLEYKNKKLNKRL